MIIVLARCGNGYCGCDSEEVFFYKDNTSTQEINEEVYIWAVENAESFSHVHFGCDEPYTDEEYDDYLENYMSYDWYVATYQEYLDYCQNWNLKPKYTEEEYENNRPTVYNEILHILWDYEDTEKEITRHKAIDAIITYLDKTPLIDKYRFDFEVWPNEEGGVAAFAFNDIDGTLRLITFSTTIQ